MEIRVTRGRTERMNPDIIVHSSVHEVEFWKRYHILCRMLTDLGEQEHLVRAIRIEGSIPEKTRDEVIAVLRAEHTQNMGVFHDFLVNFISMSLQGLHHVDISLEFSFRTEGPILCQKIFLHVDQHRKELPQEECQRIISQLSWILEESQPDKALIRVYERYQERFDRDLGDGLNRCRLEIRREVYPGSTFHMNLRLPAEVFMEEEFGQAPSSNENGHPGDSTTSTQGT
ncbi:MAG: hypothetical protein ACP5NN_01650 [Methanolinea sp.]